MRRLVHSMFLLTLLTALSALAAARPGVNDGKGIFEIRVYTITPGSMDAFVNWMEGVTKWQESVGMHILGQFAAPQENRYVWIRKYPDEAGRKKLFAAVYGSGGMKQFGTPPGYEGSDVFLARAAKSSKLQFDAAAPKAMSVPHAGAGGPVIYETRIYDIKPGSGDTFARYMGERMIPWQESAWKARILAQFVPYARVTGSADGGKVSPEDRTYIWIRVFPNEATRVEQYKMYQDPAFAKVGPPADAGFEKARIIIRANPTRFSKLQ
jgi:NIPSNAP protein